MFLLLTWVFCHTLLKRCQSRHLSNAALVRVPLKPELETRTWVQIVYSWQTSSRNRSEGQRRAIQRKESQSQGAFQTLLLQTVDTGFLRDLLRSVGNAFQNFLWQTRRKQHYPLAADPPLLDGLSPEAMWEAE